MIKKVLKKYKKLFNKIKILFIINKDKIQLKKDKKYQMYLMKFKNLKY